MEKRAGICGKMAWTMTWTFLFCMMFTTLFCVHSRAQSGGELSSLDFVLIAPDSSEKRPLLSGSPVHIMVLFTNDGSKALSIPQKLLLSFAVNEDETVQVEIKPERKITTLVPPGGFLKVNYTFEFPETLAGPVKINEARGRGNTVFVYAARPRDGICIAEAFNGEPKPIMRYDTLFQPFFVNFSPYKPVYFLFGADPGIEESTFQLSFKYKLFNFDSSDKNIWQNSLERIFFAYTQQSFWDLGSDSAPFEDSRYMPEIFYYEDDLGIELPGLNLIGSGLQIGYQHESNGRAGDMSRSTNYAYIQPTFVFRCSPTIILGIKPKVWLYVNNNTETNGDLSDYRGYFELESDIGDPEGLGLRSYYRHGNEGATWQFDLSYPLDKIPALEGFLDIFLHLQYYSGYSEQMLEYSKREDVIRLGFSLVR